MTNVDARPRPKTRVSNCCEKGDRRVVYILMESSIAGAMAV